MKQLTCKEAGGACDKVLSGETLEELGEMSKKHVMEVNDEAHQAKMEEMKAKSEEERKEFWQDMINKFNTAPDVE